MNIFNADQAETEKALLAFSEIQWPLGTFWVEGKSSKNCTAISNANLIYFVKASIDCPSNVRNYFNCEYKCK